MFHRWHAGWCLRKFTTNICPNLFSLDQWPSNACACVCACMHVHAFPSQVLWCSLSPYRHLLPFYTHVWAVTNNSRQHGLVSVPSLVKGASLLIGSFLGIITSRLAFLSASRKVKVHRRLNSTDRLTPLSGRSEKWQAEIALKCHFRSDFHQIWFRLRGNATIWDDLNIDIRRPRFDDSQLIVWCFVCFLHFWNKILDKMFLSLTHS